MLAARDSVGRLTSITYPSGNVLGMTHSEGRIINMTLNASPLRKEKSTPNAR